MSDMLTELYNNLNDKINAERQARLSNDTSVTGLANGFPVSTLAQAPLAVDGQTTYAMRIISNGRKPSEGAGLGTGVVAMYNPATNQWLRTSDYSAVIV